MQSSVSKLLATGAFARRQLLHMIAGLAILVASLPLATAPSRPPPDPLATALSSAGAALSSQLTAIQDRLARLEDSFASGARGPKQEDDESVARAPWQVGAASCIGMAGFKAASVFPERAPLVWVDFLIPAVRGKVVVQIGEREGDISLCLANYARKVFAIEMEQASCDSLRAHDPHQRVELMCKKLTPQNGNELLPDADVFLWWNEPGVNMRLVEIIHAVMKHRGRTATVFFAYDGSSNLEDLPHVAPTIKRLKSKEFGYSANVTRLFFDEQQGEGIDGDPPPDGANPKGVTADGVSGRKPWTASYTTPYFGRYGHWGIFHVVSVTVGDIDGAAAKHAGGGARHAHEHDAIVGLRHATKGNESHHGHTAIGQPQ